MNKNLLKTTFFLGTLAVASAGIASLMSNEDNRKKLKKTANDLSTRANKIIEEFEDDYQEIDKSIKKYTKSKDYKEKIEEVSNASKEIVKQLEILRKNSSELLKGFKRETEKTSD